MVRRWHADPFGFLRPYNEVPALIAGAPPSTVPSTGTGVVSAAQVVLCLIDVKMARLARDPKHLDSQVDVAGYAACLREVVR